METTQRHKDDEEEAQIPKTEFETSSEVESDKKAERSTTKLDKQAIPKKSPNLTKEEKTIKDSFFYCCQNFFTLPEMIDYMKVNHGLPKTTVTNVFRELLTGRNGESYLRASQRRALQRSSNGTTSSTVGSSSSTK
ncbi:hypothetical protein BRARA_D02779 [Brassica rapa]|uniref:Uncharacterized protein n=2 Tax=Brassica campestris TaxID=3711 RepID=M4FDX8_BRACM|nr:uncharacterized protein LOC103866256 isoform X1 [Brassica rapa]KAG5402554.1 hypothetical protein IGI04_017161 [Brassica rapa subsp. trilocularis]RID67710.1 hypothetical protein BRARA_D02779 [Brassica rapa]